MDDTILETKKLTKEFRGFVAVNGVVCASSAGRSMPSSAPTARARPPASISLTKFLPPTSGTITFNGIDITREHPARIARRGIIRSFQISAVFPHLTVLENVRMGLQRRTGTSFHCWRRRALGLGALNRRAARAAGAGRPGAFAEALPSSLPPGRNARSRSPPRWRWSPSFMVLDEPTPGMGHEDVDRVHPAHQDGGGRGRTILMVEHNLYAVISRSPTPSPCWRAARCWPRHHAEVPRATPRRRRRPIWAPPTANCKGRTDEHRHRHRYSRPR